MKNKTCLRPIGGFKSVLADGSKTKTYVYIGIQADKSETVYVIQYVLSKNDPWEWECVKTFKEYGLYKNEIHIKLESLYGIIKVLEPHIDTAYDLMREYLATKQNPLK